MSGVTLDSFSIVLLVTPADPPHVDDAAAARLQDAHLNHLAELHEAGHLLAAGPLRDGEGSRYRGLTILNVEPERARELCERDPAVQAGWFDLEVLPWLVPEGALRLNPTRFPHSAAEVQGPDGDDA